LSEDKTIVVPIEIPGMQITFRSQIGPFSKEMSFALGVDALISVGALNERLDIIAAAGRRQDAFEQLERDRQSLAANKKLLPEAQAKRAELEKDRAKAVEAMAARQQAVAPNRRVKPDTPQAAPFDISLLASLDRDIKEQDKKVFEIEA